MTEQTMSNPHEKSTSSSPHANAANSQTLAPVPDYDTIVERNGIGMLHEPGDLALRNGDLALTKWGDLMLNNEDYSAFFKLVQEWRYNYPTLKVLFETVFDTFAWQRRLAQEIEGSVPTSTPAHPDPLFNPEMDPAAFHRATDQHGAAEVARGTYAGALVIIIDKMLRSFKDDIVATDDEWKRSAPLVNGPSLGQILQASANNFRHNEEWARARPPSERQLKSIKILSAAFQETIAPDGRGHKFAREICPETLQLISDGDFALLESAVFAFANNLMALRQIRLPTQ